MEGKFTALTDELHRYLVEHGARQDDLLARVERDTAEMGDIANMQVAADEGALLTLLTRLTGARFAVEVGTFTGYSAICIARGLAPGGQLLCCENDEGYAATARANLRDGGLDDVVEVRLGEALETLQALPREETIDLAFVDADKQSYPSYYEELLVRVRRGGLLLLDNVLLGSRVLDPRPDDSGARAIAELNDRIVSDDRVDVAMIGVADGVTLALKR